ncbi:MAG: 1-acyl-sn-glycerol-3-phosphate acyltransferase [Bacteroidota bacterium]
MRILAAALLRWLAEVAVRIYYPRRTLEGAQHLPPTGPTLYVANHPNGLLDPLVLRVCIGRRARFLAKSTLWGNPFGRLAMDAFGCLPVYRRQDHVGRNTESTTALNDETFARCRVELSAGAELALYPEGASHSDPQLKPLKPGAARIALSAAAEAAGGDGRRIPVVVPVGSHYEDKARFRSGVHLVIGAPIDLAAHGARFAEDQRQGVEALTDEIRARLDGLVLQAETRDLLNGIARVASWTASDPDDDAPERRLARARELAAAYRRLQTSDPARVDRIARETRRYARTLRALGVQDPWALEIPRVTAAGVMTTLARAVLITPLAVWGVVTSWPAYRLSGVLAARATKDEDILSTMKMIGGAAFLTAAWISEALFIGYHRGVAWAFASLLLAPLAGYAALRWGETLGQVAAAIRHFGWRARGPAVDRMIARRRRLAQEVTAALRDSGSRS